MDRLEKAIATVLLVAWVAACSPGSESGETGQLLIQVLTPVQSGKNPYQGIRKLAFDLTQNGTPVGSDEVEFDGSAFIDGTQTLPALDIELDDSRWDNLRLTITGYALGGEAQFEIFSRGRTAGFSLSGGQVLNLSVYLSPVGEFSSPGDLQHPRYGHTASLLPDGRVLVVGGAATTDPLETGNLVEQAEIYDPATGSFSTVASSAGGRMFHSATVLSDGRVLIYGGLGPGDLVLEDVVMFDPQNDSFSTLTLQPSLGPRLGHTASLLPVSLAGGGVVLIAGGASSYPIGSILETGFRIDPDAGTTSPVGNDLAARAFHQAVPTGNAMGEVVLIGGIDEQGAVDSVEVYNSQEDLFQALVSNPDSRDSMLQPRVGHSASLLLDSAMFIMGGNSDFLGVQTDTHLSAEVFSPDLFGLIDSAAFPGDAREWHSATTLEDGRVLVAGGRQVSQGIRTFLAAAEILVPDDSGSTDHYDCSFEPAGDGLQSARSVHTATRLLDGTVLLIGGLGQNGGVPAAEIFNPADSDN